MIRALLLALAVLISAGVNARTVKGRVLDEHGEPLAYSTVKLKHSRVGVLSDTAGVFCISAKNVRDNDTLTVHYLGYDIYEIPLESLKDSEKIRIEMRPSATLLPEVTVIPAKKLKRRTKGKKHSWALLKTFLDGETAGDCYGYEFHAKKNKKLVLDKVGFFFCEGERQMKKMKFRINIYDMGNVKGSPTRDFVSVLSKPIYFDYNLDETRKSGKFEFRLPECIVLPKDAMVEIEFLENLGDEMFWFKCNLVGRRTWDKYIDDDKWLLNPFATPFFVECLEMNAGVAEQ